MWSFNQIDRSTRRTFPVVLSFDLNLIGTNTTNLSYNFPGGFTVASGATLSVEDRVLPVQSYRRARRSPTTAS